MNERLMDVRQVAAALGVSTRKVWTLRDQGAMPMPVRIGASVRWKASDLDLWIQGGCLDCRTHETRGRRGMQS
jgi:predicted DNA-binding transcriptional regulator AlpA